MLLRCDGDGEKRGPRASIPGNGGLLFVCARGGIVKFSMYRSGRCMRESEVSGASQRENVIL